MVIVPLSATLGRARTNSIGRRSVISLTLGLATLVLAILEGIGASLLEPDTTPFTWLREYTSPTKRRSLRGNAQRDLELGADLEMRSVPIVG